MPGPIGTLLDLLTTNEFLAGVVLGAVLLLAFLLLRRMEAMPGWGIAIALATLVGVHMTIGRRLSLATGVALMAAGGWLLAQERMGEGWDPAMLRPAAWATVVVGAILTSWRSGLPEGTWVPFALPVVAIVAAWAIRTWEGELDSYVGPLFLVSAFGVWATVPETAAARILLGAALVLAVATLSPIRARVTSAGAFALAGVFTWVVAIGGTPRPASIVGGWACLALLALLPYLRQWLDGPLLIHPAVLVGGHLVTVLVASRVIGLWESALIALIAAAVLGAIVSALLVYLSARAAARAEGQ